LLFAVLFLIFYFFVVVIEKNFVFRKNKAERTLPGSKYSWKNEFNFRNDPENRRKIAALQTDHSAGSPFYLYLRNSGGPISSLRFWQDVEKCRLDYDFGTMDFSDFSTSVNIFSTFFFIMDYMYSMHYIPTV